MNKVIYTRNGKDYFKITRYEKIKEGALQSWCGGELQPITNSDGKTVGSTPADFSNEREFFNPVK